MRCRQMKRTTKTRTSTSGCPYYYWPHSKLVQQIKQSGVLEVWHWLMNRFGSENEEVKEHQALPS